MRDPVRGINRRAIEQSARCPPLAFEDTLQTCMYMHTQGETRKHVWEKSVSLKVRARETIWRREQLQSLEEFLDDMTCHLSLEQGWSQQRKQRANCGIYAPVS